MQIWVKELNLKQTKVSKKIETTKIKTNKKSDRFILPDLVLDFLNYLESIKGKSPNTINAYKTDLKMFFRFLNMHFEIVDYTTDDIEFKNINIKNVDEDFVREIKLRDLYAFLKFVDSEKENKSHAKARKVATLKSFFNFIHTKLKVIKENPAAELESPKIEKRHPIYLSLDESLALLSNMDKNDSNYYRDYCILILFLNCGLRLSELCSISIKNINSDTLKVIGKGNKERTVYLNDSCIQSINDYLDIRDTNKIKIGDRDFLFISKQNRAISKMAVENVVKKHIQSSQITTLKISPHKLRHTAATLMYKHGGVDIRALQSILGHESVSTTQIYTHIDDENLRNAMKSNPLANIKNKNED
ncbi:MAG: tyrosine recombinase XerC [Sarcina sp.]